MNIFPKILTEALYIRDESEKACVRTDPEKKERYLKFDGSEEELDPNSKLGTDIMIEGSEITKEQYEAY